MKELFNKIGALFLALLILGSTTSWTVQEHYCLGHLVEVSFFDSPDGCGMDMDASEEMSCCTEEVYVEDGQDQLQLNYEGFEPMNPDLLAAALFVWVVLFEEYPVEQAPNYIHPPPKLVKDIQLLDEVFLI